MKPPQIHQHLAAVLAEVGAISKERTNETGKWKFRGVDDVYNALHDHFARHQIYVRPEVVEFRQADRRTSDGWTNIHTVVKMRYHFTCGADGSSVAMEVPGEAADSGDKGLGKACQYAYKLLLLQMFLIPTEGDNDPDDHATKWGNGQQQTPPVQPTPQRPPWPEAINQAPDEALPALRQQIISSSKLSQDKKDRLLAQIDTRLKPRPMSQENAA